MLLHNYLASKESPQNLTTILLACACAGKYINAQIRMKDAEKNKSANATGDTQSALDLIADDILVEHLSATNLVKTIASEERDDTLTIDTATDTYFVAYDPYDGGSVGDANITFGSIIGIWSDSPIGKAAGTHMVASLTILYGPRVTLMIALPDSGVALFELDEVGEFFLVRKDITVSDEAQHFAPGNLKACNSNPLYKSLIDQWIKTNHKLRYSGALVTDVNHILVKGNGIFTYPADNDYPDGRLRLLYEGAPLAHMLTTAGATGLTQDGTKLLDVIVNTPHQRTSLFLGSTDTATTAAKHLSQ